MSIPVEVIVDGMIDTAAIFAAVTDVERCNPEMVEKDGVVGAGSKCTDLQVPALSDISPVVCA